MGIEACASSHHWSRELKALGYTVRLPAYVKPYVKRQKNDVADAEDLRSGYRGAYTVRRDQEVYSLALRLARVAFGAIDVAFASPGSHDRDLAAADLLVHEAGGLLTDFAGRPLNYNGPQVEHSALIAAGHTRHGSLLELVRDHEAEFA